MAILLLQETHEKYFYSTEHWNYFTNDEDLGPVILSLKQVGSLLMMCPTTGFPNKVARLILESRALTWRAFKTRY